MTTNTYDPIPVRAVASPSRIRLPLDEPHAPRPPAVARWALPGVLGGILVAAGGVITGPRPRGVDFGSVHRIHALFGSRPVLVVAYGVLYIGLALLVGTWLRLGRAIRDGDGPDTAQLVRIFACWVAPLAFGPPLFSRDVYSYAAQGRMVLLGLNPYVVGPAALRHGRYLRAVAPMWRHTPAPYGPLFLSLAAGVVGLAGRNLVVAVLGLRTIELVGVAALAYALPRLAAHHGVSPRAALWLGLLNPLVLLHLVSGAHNDALMIGLLAVGLLAAEDGHPVLGLLACTFASAVKVPAILGGVYIGLHWLRHERRFTVVVKGVATVAAAYGLLMLASGLGWGWITALNTPGKVRTPLTPVTGLAMAIGAVAHTFHSAVPTLTLIAALRKVGLVVAAAVAGYLALTRRVRPVRAAAVALSVLVVLGPVVQPWYLTWGVVLLAVAGAESLQPFLVAASTVLAFVTWPSGSGVPAPLQAVAVVVIAALGIHSFARHRRPPAVATTPTESASC